MKGIEPSYAAWEAAVLPLNYTRANSGRRCLPSPDGRRNPAAGWCAERLMLSNYERETVVACEARRWPFISTLPKLRQMTCPIIGSGLCNQALLLTRAVATLVCRDFNRRLVKRLPKVNERRFDGRANYISCGTTTLVREACCVINELLAIAGLLGMSPKKSIQQPDAGFGGARHADRHRHGRARANRELEF